MTAMSGGLDQHCLKQADLALNKTYKALMSHMSEPGTDKLLWAGRSWLVWRDAHCAFDTANVQGGSAASLATTTSMTALAREQAKYLPR
jgi:uncharacterized protein YecT (DUF1311 family)